MEKIKPIIVDGCGHEEGAIWICVGSDNPTRVGRNPVGEEDVCSLTPLEEVVKLGVNITGNELKDSRGGNFAEVLVSCTAKNCPHHKEFKE